MEKAVENLRFAGMMMANIMLVIILSLFCYTPVYGANEDPEEPAYSDQLIASLEEMVGEDNMPLFTKECVFGLVANVIREGGNNGTVQWQFSAEGAYGFKLPSGGKAVQTRDDVIYLKNWTTSDEESIAGLPLKGSCGVSAVQWSYGRRIKWCDILLEIIGDSTNVSQEDILLTDIKMIAAELSKDGKFWSNITAWNPETPSDWANAICRCYVAPRDVDWAADYACGVANWLSSTYDEEVLMAYKAGKEDCDGEV